MGSSSKQEEVTMEQVLQEQTRLEEEANEVLPFDITRCSKPLGQIRQSVYSCLTCNPVQAGQRAGVCSSCSVSCHTDHQLVELFVRRNFVCECGTRRCNPNQCQLDHPLLPNDQETLANSIQPDALINNYDKNFDGQFCICERGKNYDPEIETEDMYQCLSCEDWRHAGCLGPHPDADEWEDLICANCVQNDPVISSIMFKYAGGDNTGILVCTNSEICYGKLSSTSNPDPPSAEETVKDSNIQTCNTTQSESHTQSNLSIQNLIHDQSSKNDLEIDKSHLDQKNQVDVSLKNTSQVEQDNVGMIKASESDEDCVDFKSSNYDPAKNQSKNDKRPPSPSLIKESKEEEEKNKKPKLEEKIKTSKIKELNDSINHPQETFAHCIAPFKNRSESILNKLDPKFSNVYLINGWRNRWCKCSNCLNILSKLDWLIHEEEEVWEPGEDTESLKSIHELGLEAIKKLPRDQLINGLIAFNQFKQEFLNFLKPFHSDNKLITELDIHQFFLNIKSNIVKH